MEVTSIVSAFFTATVEFQVQIKHLATGYGYTGVLYNMVLYPCVYCMLFIIYWSTVVLCYENAPYKLTRTILQDGMFVA